MPKHTYVPAIGPKDASIMLIGEGPGGMELLKGKPFVGPAGSQLDRMLSAAGLDRGELYITNVTKTKKKTFFEKGQPSAWYMEGILNLLQEIKTVNPNVVVPLGNFALWALTQEKQISKWRGSIMESTLVPGLKVLPTYHPAFYIHQGHYNSHKEALGVWDLSKVAEESKTPNINLPSPNIITNPTTEQIWDAVERLKNADHITADTEWYAPEKLAMIGFSDSPDWAIVIPAETLAAYRAYKEILGSDVPKVWQNAMFDDVALDRVGIKVNNVVHDTMVEWHSCWTDLREKSLAVQTSVLTKHPYYKEDLEFVGKDDRGQIYCGTDVVATDESHAKMQENELEYTGGRRGYEISMSIYPLMSEASKRGILCDRDKLLEMKQGYLDRADYIERTLSDTVGYTLNCRSAKQVAHLVYDQLGVNRKKRTTRQDVLMDIAAGTSDEQLKTILTAIVRVRQNRNMVSRYINEDIVDRDGRIRTNWNLAGTRSGRLSSTDPWWNGVAIQTMPEDAREVCTADPGTVFIGWDLAQAEARVVAIKSRDYELIEAMDSGMDIHVKLASELPFGKSYEQLMAEIESKVKDEVYERYLAKKCRHALNYVMGSGTFRATVNKEYLDTGVGIDTKQARQLHKAYLDLHDGLQIWWKEVSSRMSSHPRVIENCFGRRRTFLGYPHDTLHREAVSFEPQSTIADLTTISMVEADKELKKLDPSAQFFAHMHDGGFLQIKEECRDEAAAIIMKHMTKEIIVDNTPLTVPVEVKTGYDWKNLKGWEG